MRQTSPGFTDRPDDRLTLAGQHTANFRFDEPGTGQRSWAAPPGHGTYRGTDLQLLDPGDDDELMVLIEALHDESNAPGGDRDLTAAGEPGSQRLHVTMHQIVARQILAREPPQTWQAVQRLAGLGYDWHSIMHMIAALVSQDVDAALAEHRQPDPADYARRLDRLPGGWPAAGD